MKPRTMILLVVAVVCGLAAMYMTNRLLADKAAPPPPVNNVKVLVSKQKIAAWLPMHKPEDYFEEKEVPEGTYSSKCITDLSKLKDQALKEPLNEQMPVTDEQLATAATMGLIGQLKKGQRATAIKVTPESLAGGFVLPGSKVDVMFIKKRDDGNSSAQIILQDMLVLAVDMKKARAEGEDSMLGNTATLATTPEEAEQLALASAMGDLRLLLRTPLDPENRKQYQPIGIGDVAHQLRTSAEEPKAEPTDTDPGANPSGAVDTLPKVGTTPTPTPAPPEKVADKTPPAQPEKPAEDVPPPPPPTHTLHIVQGGAVTETKFTWDARNGCWEGGVPTKTPAPLKAEDAAKPDAGSKPGDAPKAKDADKPAAPKAPADDAAHVG